MNFIKIFATIFLSMLLMLPSYTTAMDERPKSPSKWLTWQTGTLTGATVSLLTLALIWRTTSKKPIHAAPIPAESGFTTGFKHRAGERIADAAYYTVLLSTIAAGGSFIWNMISGKNAQIKALWERLNHMEAEHTRRFDHADHNTTIIQQQQKIHTLQLDQLNRGVVDIQETQNIQGQQLASLATTQTKNTKQLSTILCELEHIRRATKRNDFGHALNGYLTCLSEEEKTFFRPVMLDVLYAVETGADLSQIPAIRRLIADPVERPLHVDNLSHMDIGQADHTMNCSRLAENPHTRNPQLQRMIQDTERVCGHTLTITRGTPQLQSLSPSRH